jgi:hypothetical protein
MSIKPAAAQTGRYEIIADRALRVSWGLSDGSTLQLVANLHPEPLDGIDVWGGRRLWLEGFANDHTLQGWGVIWSLQNAGLSAGDRADNPGN